MPRTLEATRSGPGQQPTISLRRTPRCEPPFDDELEPTVWATAHQLALNLAQPAPADLDPGATAPGSGGAGHSPAGVSADARLAVRRFVRACVEVLNGYRPAIHLRRLARPLEASEVVAQGTAAFHRVSELRAAQPADHRPRRRPPVAVLHVRLCEPRPGAVEAAVALLTVDRTWALALRLEMHQEVWRATTLRLI
ncbi:Rv3235 family protein [Paractinoplanes maris]|uniref:Rv3235 family protein n=1 Tax=Paractinoplanes maris TaxID=1734446 RepID=UPI0020212F97|nr:Rv3235 family protein [Actinoplanes maris]